MADYSPPFGNTGDRRFPNVSERSGGFPCAGADYTLFNGLEYAGEAEIGEVITGAGLAPSNGDLTQFRQAIAAMVADAIYGLDLPETPPDPDLSDYLLLNTARSRLPIFPFVMTANGRAGVYSPGAGYVRVPGGVWVTHRGVYQFSTHETTFATQANKTYHVRWQWDGASNYVLKDLSDPTYNPGSLAETDAAFDSTYDDMLLARVVTTGANAVQVTDLQNSLVLAASALVNVEITRKTSYETIPNSGIAINWARTPTQAQIGFRLWKSNVTDVDGRYYPASTVGVIQAIGISSIGANRYYSGDATYHYFDNGALNGHLHAEWTLEA